MHAAKARGGTELMSEAVFARLPKNLLDRAYVSISAASSGPRHLKPHIFWAHQAHDQPSVQNLSDPQVVSTIDAFVFVSEWQRAQYLLHFPIPASKTVVIRNAIEPIPVHQKEKGKMRLVYTSTPFRGLDVLLEAFEMLSRSDAELHIYSGMTLYGRPEEDARFAGLYARARGMKNVFYHGAVSNEEVREVLAAAHIFAYPNTWEESSCFSLIEAMSAGCAAVVPALGALPETAAGFANMYPYEPDKNLHAKLFAKELDRAIEEFWQPETQATLARQKEFFDKNYSWDTRIGEWVALLRSLTEYA